MECQHKVELNTGSFTIPCKICSDNRTFQTNRDLLRQVLSSKNLTSGQKSCFVTLLNQVSWDGRLGRYVAPGVEHQRESVKAMVSALEQHIDPRLIHIERGNNRIIVFNPFTRNQDWNELALPPPSTPAPAGPTQAPGVIAGLTLVDYIYAIPVDRVVKARKPQSRQESNPGFSAESIDSLARSLVKNGQITAIVVRIFYQGKDPKPWFELVAGERRWRAAKKAGQKYLKGIILSADTTEEQLRLIMNTENMDRVGLTWVDLILEAERLITEEGWTQEQVAAIQNVSSSLISARRPIASMGVAALAILNANHEKISVAQALLLAKRVPDHKAQLITVQGWLLHLQDNKQSRTRSGDKRHHILDFAPEGTVVGVSRKAAILTESIQGFERALGTVKSAATRLLAKDSEAQLEELQENDPEHLARLLKHVTEAAPKLMQLKNKLERLRNR